MECEQYVRTSNEAFQTNLSNRTNTAIKVCKEKEIDLHDLAKEFAALKLSVAGVSNIVKSRSVTRRYLWFICVLVVTIFMGYMTTKVILEYLSYPKMMIIEDTILHKLPFPAVTICSLNPISNFYVKRTSLKKLAGLKELIENTKAERRSYYQRDKCLSKPLCRWSWFQEKCHCIRDPCLSEFCLPEDNSHCRCLPGFCARDSAMHVDGCRSGHILSAEKKVCLCNGTSTQEDDDSAWEEEDNEGLLDLIKDDDVKELIRLVRESETFDLLDIDEALQPTTQELYRYGENYDSLITSCTFQGTHCYRENFTALYDPTYGRCYMFNYVGNSAAKPVEVDTFGSKSGLQLMVRVADKSVLDLVRREIGARIVIHDPHVLPFVSEFGLNVRPKDMTALELSYSKVQKLGSPWGNCVEETSLPNGEPYSLLGCEKQCSHETLMNHCGCTMRHLLQGRKFLENLETNYTLCNISIYEEFYCSLEVMDIIDSTAVCDCKSPCRQTIYSYSAASSKLNEKFYNTVKAIRTLKLNQNGTELRHINFTSLKSMLGVKVYFNTFEVSSQSEVPSYSWETLMANIGGNLGFFMGFTLITFLELAEFMWDSIIAACRRFPFFRKNRKLSMTISNLFKRLEYLQQIPFVLKFYDSMMENDPGNPENSERIYNPDTNLVSGTEGEVCIRVPQAMRKLSVQSNEDIPSPDVFRKVETDRIDALAKELAALKVSVSGISNIVNSRSALRRYLWFICVMICMSIMVYMTTKVILEYLNYPKMLIVEDTIFHKLPFPAVTICTLNPIASLYFNSTSLAKYLRLKKLIQNIVPERRSFSRRELCLRNPLCRWSWFDERCNCISSPCLTEFCLLENASQCRCFPIFCESETRNANGCKMVYTMSAGREVCICNATSNQTLNDNYWEKDDITDLLKHIESKEVQEIIQLVRKSETFDLVDVEEGLQPTTQELYQYGGSFDSMVVSCTFEGTRCHRENFTALYDPTYGKCYMFNYIGNDVSGAKKPIEIESYGSYSGLQLLLRVVDFDALNLLRREIGARIVIHDSHVLPFVSEYGVNVRPKDMTTLELSYSKIQRLEGPWGNCHSGPTLANGEPYTLLGCEKQCAYETMMKVCGCAFRHMLHGTVLQKLQVNYTFCNISDEVQKECVTEVMAVIEYHGTAECDCKTPCRENIYSYMVASSKLNEDYYNTVKAIRTLKLDPETEKLRHVNYSSQKSMLGVKVYFNSFEVSTQREVPSYSWETLMANIGGNMGFFMGFTLITFLEIAEFILDSVTAACRKTPPISSSLRSSTVSLHKDRIISSNMK